MWTDNIIWNIIPLCILAVWSVLHSMVPWKAVIKLRVWNVSAMGLWWSACWEKGEATFSNLINFFCTFFVPLLLFYWVNIWRWALLLLNVWDSPSERVDFWASHAGVISSVQQAFLWLLWTFVRFFSLLILLRFYNEVTKVCFTGRGRMMSWFCSDLAAWTEHKYSQLLYDKMNRIKSKPLYLFEKHSMFQGCSRAGSHKWCRSLLLKWISCTHPKRKAGLHSIQHPVSSACKWKKHRTKLSL